jgi:hypothetical protein
MRPTSLALEVRISSTVPGSQPHWTLSHLQGQARAVNQAITPPVPLLWSFSFGPLYQGVRLVNELARLGSARSGSLG